MKVKKNNAYLLLSLIFLVAIAASILIFNPIKSVIQSRTDYGFVSVPELENYFSDKQYNIDIKNYEIDLELFTEDETISAEVVIEGVYKDSTLKQIDLNFYDNMEISSILLNDMAVEYIHDNYRLSIFDDDKTTEEFRIEISYSGSPQNLGMGSFNFDEEYEREYVYTLSEPVYASSWFPCNDLPNDKALARISITNDSSAVSISNGVLEKIEIEDDKKTYSWQTVYPISTYLIAIYSGEYKKFSQQYVSIGGKMVNFDYYVTPEKFQMAKIDFDFHPQIFKVFENLFGEYPFVDEKYSVIEFFWPYGAMEHQTVTGMSSRFIGGKNFFRDIYIHEVAHHWWGNAVGPETWKDVWLNEGFATYSEALYYEKISGYSSLVSTLQSKFRDYTEFSLYDPGPNMFGSMVYNKGAWVLHMLRKEIGDEDFFTLLRNYFETYKYKNASTENLKTLAEEVSGKDLKTFFDQWIYFGKGLILLEYDSEIKELKGTFETRLKISQFQEEYGAYHFPLDVEIKSVSGAKKDFGFYITTLDTTLILNTKFNPDEITLDPDSWLMAIISKTFVEETVEEEFEN